MNSEFHRKNIFAIYRRLGIRPGDVVFIHARLFTFGQLADDKDEFVRIFLDPLMRVVDFPRGTIVVITYTTRYSSFGEPYKHEKTPSEAGILSEYVRTMKGAVRSFHPLGSVAAIGKDKHFICEGISRSQFGWNSVYHRMHILHGKCLYLGITLGQTCTFLHYVEHFYGVSYCYHKAFFHPAYRRGKLQRGPFLAFLRNRKSEPYDFSKFERRMRGKALLKEALYANGPIQVVAFDDCFTEGMKVLSKNPCYFIREPFYATE